MNRKIVVTGGTSGIGAAVVQGFLDEGDRIIILDRSSAEPIPGVSWVGCDLTDKASIDEAIVRIEDAFDAEEPNIDVLCNIAGVAGVEPVETVMAVNYLAPCRLADKLAPRVVTSGSVVNIASTAGWGWRDRLPELQELVSIDQWDDVLAWSRQNLPSGYDAYQRSKQAIIVWSSVAAQQYLGRFRVNSVSPGPVETPLLADFYDSMGHDELDPLTARGGGRNGTPVEIAQVVRFLASPLSSWINGTDVVADAGAEMAEMLASEGIMSPLRASGQHRGSTLRRTW